MQTKRRGVIPLVLGLLMMFVAAPALLIGGAAYGIRGIVNVAEDASVYQPGATVALTKDEPVLIMVDTGPASGNSLETKDGAAPQSCTITAPAGVELTASGSTQGITANFQGRHWESAGSYVVPASGDYAFTCAGPAKIFTGDDVQKLSGSSIVAVVFGVLGSLAVGLLGLILTIVGIVKLVRSGRERRAGGGYGYGGPGNPYAGTPAPQNPYGTPAQQNPYAAPPAPAGNSAPYGSGSSAPYGSAPPRTSGSPQDTSAPRTDTTPIPQPGTNPPPAGGTSAAPPPPPSSDTPVWRDPTA